jgi:hypothetical protein
MITGHNGAILSGGTNPWHFEYQLNHNGDPKDPLSKSLSGSGTSPGGSPVEQLVLQEEYILPI